MTSSSRCLLLESISEIVQIDGFYDEWADQNDAPALAHLLRGSLQLKRAWVYRGYGRGTDVGEESFGKMDAALEISLRDLYPIIDDVLLGQEACARLIRSLMGVSEGGGWAEIDSVHGHMRSFGDGHLLGEVNYLLASCEKWLGSHEKMFFQARETVKDFKTNPNMGALVAVAHWEKHMHIERFEEDEVAASAYLADGEVMEEVTLLSQKLLEAPQLNFTDGVIAHNIFAAFFCEFSRYDLARPHFDRMGKCIIRYPWEFFLDGDLQKMYNRSLRTVYSLDIK